MSTAAEGSKRKLFYRDRRGKPNGHWWLEVRVTDHNGKSTIEDFPIRARDKAKAASKAFLVVKRTLGKYIAGVRNPRLKASLRKLSKRGNIAPVFVLSKKCDNLDGALNARKPAQMFREAKGWEIKQISC